ncbi:MAG: tRNA 2-thiocytidine biosynthesis TtcA family protein [Spirochaetaceae bacterium]|jgi:tRNA 2-thiocytidine biosynthesis protein TtcA|nr:tRNA 2-thiocytidine biosynthesis TtcA family protein [Spirochaetaceae bacterium]
MAHRAFRKYDASTLVQKLVAKAVFDRALINAGDKILVAASGGKDSTVMALMLSRLRGIPGFNYELAALHISSDFCACCKKAALKELLEGWEIPFTDLFVPVIGRLKKGRSMNCYWCSTQRRIELLRYAIEHGFTAIALGHHLDDIIETFFMNMCAAGELKTMPALLRYRKYPVKLIRPLAYVEERQIIECAEANGILKTACTCPYGRFSKRRVMRRQIEEFTGGSPAVKRRILASFTARNFDLLVE